MYSCGFWHIFCFLELAGKYEIGNGLNLAVGGSCLPARVFADEPFKRHLTFLPTTGSSTVRPKPAFKGRNSSIEDKPFPYGGIGPAGTGFDSRRGMGNQINYGHDN